jgi:hypothetical protein
MANSVPSDQLVDLQQNVQTTDTYVNSTALTVTARPTPTDPTGKVIKTLAGISADVELALQRIGVQYSDPITDWTALTEITAFEAHRYPATTGDLYIPTAPLPFTTGATFDANNWTLLQGLNEAAIINDTAIPYIFPNFADMVASLIVFPLGKTLKTKVRATDDDGGGASYIVTTGATAEPVGSPDLSSGAYYAALNTSGGAINVAQFGGDANAAVAHYLAKSIEILVANNVFKHGSATNMLIQSAEDDQPNRIHQEPKNNIETGTVTKYDSMFTPYESDTSNYAISQWVNTIGDVNDTGEGMITTINAKSVGTYWGNWPAFHFGFNDDSAQGMAAKLVLTEWTGTEWYTPMKGGWYNGKPVTVGDYITASNKIYQATTTGQCGNIIPSHTSGTVSDGSVSFEWIHTPNGNALDAVMMFGERDDMPMFNYPNCHLQVLTPMAIGRTGRIDFAGDNDLLHTRMEPVTGGGGEKITDWKTQDGLGVFRMDATNKQLKKQGLSNVVVASVQNGTDSPSAAATELVRFGNTVAQDVVRFNDAVADQVFMVDTTTAGSGFTTIKGNGSPIKTISGNDIVLTEFMVLMFKMNWDGTRAIQIKGD